MGTFENHKNLYSKLKKDAEIESLSIPSRVELYFLSIFHLIESCAAKTMIHINKHQNIRKILEDNKTIFKEETEIIWKLFQKLENKLRPKFSYGFSWTDEDFKVIKDIFSKLEKICLTVIEN